MSESCHGRGQVSACPLWGKTQVTPPLDYLALGQAGLTDLLWPSLLHHWSVAGSRCLVVVTPDFSQMHAAARALGQWTVATSLPVITFPHQVVWSQGETDAIALEADRVAALGHLLGSRPVVLVTTFSGLLQRIDPRERWAEASMSLVAGDEVDLDELLEGLEKLGFLLRPEVETPGSAWVRGAVLDLFPVASRTPYRVVFLGDQIESIRPVVRCRDEVTLGAPVAALELTPARELLPASPAWRDGVQALHARALDLGLDDSLRAQLLFRIEAGQRFASFAAAYPLFRHASETLAQWLPSNSWVFSWEGAAAGEQLHQRELAIAAQSFAVSHQACGWVVPPEEHFAPPATEPRWAQLPASGCCICWDGPPQPPTQVPLNVRLLPSDGPWLAQVSQAAGQGPVVVVAEDAARRLDLGHELAAAGLDSVQVVGGKLSFHLLDTTGTSWFADTCEEDAREASVFDIARHLESLRELSPGDRVVHEEHGVGRFDGLVNWTPQSGLPGDYLKIVYRDGGVIYAPVHDLGRVHLAGAGKDTALDRLGTESWQRRRSKVETSSSEIARELLAIHSQRERMRRPPYGPPSELMRELEASCPFELTRDQYAALADTERDLAEERPMDRILVGDVGFGKTEIALRLVFRAVLEGYQAFVLAPTTLLVWQHLATWTRRLEPYGVRVVELSRHVNGAVLRRRLDGLAQGTVDVAIGTHRLLSRDVTCRRLGVVVVDEEHKFGVRAKERIKQIRGSVDLLSMTATPIPRTLHLASLGLRSVSLLCHPPGGRLPVITRVVADRDPPLRDAIAAELARDGQVFILCDRIAKLEPMRQRLHALSPRWRISTVHGQMPVDATEHEMRRFTQRHLDILVATTLLESGIDLPRVNTLLVMQPASFGLAQLHQLRGRVGRSTVSAYCYLVVGDGELTPEATQRLETFVTNSQLGAGFALASRDLELRGVGELLGLRQSGHLAQVGVDLYLKMLRQHLNIHGGKIQPPPEPRVDVDPDAALSPEWIADASTRLRVYKKIILSQKTRDLDQLRHELRHRYGPLPEVSERLFLWARAKVLLQQLYVVSLERHPTLWVATLAPAPGEVEAAWQQALATLPGDLHRLSEQSIAIGGGDGVAALLGHLQAVARHLAAPGARGNGTRLAQ